MVVVVVVVMVVVVVNGALWWCCGYWEVRLCIGGGNGLVPISRGGWAKEGRKAIGAYGAEGRRMGDERR